MASYRTTHYAAMCNEHAAGNRSPIRWREIGEDHALAPTAELLQRADHEYEPELKHAYRR